MRPISILLTLSLIVSCSTREDKTKNDQSKIEAIIEEWTKSFQEHNKEKILSFFLTDEKLPDILFSQPSDISIDFKLSDLKIDVQSQGNFTAILPYTVSSKNSDFRIADDQEFVLWKVGDNEDVKITSFSANLANSMLRVIQNVKDAKELDLRYDSLFQHVEHIANTLRSQYDSIVYYTKVDTLMLFYVVKGAWVYPYENKPKTSYKIGVVDRFGKPIIPVEFDKIYNPNGTVNGCIEVQKNGKKGLFKITGEEFIKTEYDAIYPYTGDEAVACYVKENGLPKAVSMDGKISVDKIDRVETISKLISKWSYNYPGNITMLQYPYRPTMYNTDDNHEVDPFSGVIVTPSYLFELGIIKREYQSDLYIEGFGMDENRISVVETKTISEKILAVFTLFYESGVDARGYSFRRNDLITLNEQLDTVSSVFGLISNSDAYYGFCENESYKQVDTNLFEVTFQKQQIDLPYETITQYRYYKIHQDGMIEHLTGNRLFNFTKYVKMDESYLNTCAFNYISPESNHNHYNLVVFNELSYNDLDVMRNEIYAEYGYIFKSEKWKKFFKAKPWYKPQYENVDDQLTEIDRHNINFILEHQKQIKGKKIKPDSVSYVAAG